MPRGGEVLEIQTRSAGRLRAALAVRAAVWLLLLLVGFVAPGGRLWRE